MKRCDYSYWLSLYAQGIESVLLESDRLQVLTNQIISPYTQQPSLIVFLGNTTKSRALRELFGVRDYKARRKQGSSEIHLYLDASSIFHSRPIYLADGDFTKSSSIKIPATNKCHETTRRALLESSLSLNERGDEIYSRLLFPFTDVFCIFSDDLSGFRQVARYLSTWLEQGQASTLPKSTYPRVIVITENIPLTAEREARKGFLQLLEEETTKDISEKFSAIDIVALFPRSQMSAEARYRRLKESILNGSDQVRRNREDTQTLFSAIHFSAFFKYACDHFCKSSTELFDFIKASRIQTPVSTNLREHLSNFLKHIKATKELTEFAVLAIASSFLLDNYLPDTHGKYTDL